MKSVSKYEPLEHYKWGNDCDGWRLVKEKNLSVIQECMPAGTTETKHYHQDAQQFFFILRGRARFEVEDEIIEVQQNQGLHIAAGKKHRIVNDTNEELEFLLCSQPSTANDRVICE